MAKPLISVIVPIYNVEKYLDKCVESIVNQTYKNLEIILVDDGSPDNCPQMCDEWAKRDDRIKVIHKENGGVSSARNAGLDNANGEYIGFVDGDDIVERDFYEKLTASALKENADISLCAFKYYNFEEKAYVKGTEYKNCRKILNGEDACRELFKTFNGHFISFCNKIVKRSLFDEFVFPQGRMFEDWTLAPMIYSKCKKIVYIPDELYIYIVHQNSIVRTETVKRYCDCVFADFDHFVFFNSKNNKLYNKEIQCIVWSDFCKACRVYFPTNENKLLINSAYSKAKSICKNKKGDIFYHSRLVLPYLYAFWRKLK